MSIDAEELEALRRLERAVRANNQQDDEDVCLAMLDAIRARAKQAEADRTNVAPYLECGRCRYVGDEMVIDPTCPLHRSKP